MKSTIDIRAGRRGEKTVLEKAFFTPPFKIARIAGDPLERILRLMMMCSSPGVLDGDETVLSLHLAAGACLQLETQSYQRLFRMRGAARQSINIRMDAGACLRYLPHPVVPHVESSFSACNEIRMEENCTLIWGEIITPGRQLNGEAFRFSRYQNCTEIYLQDKRVIRENVLLLPGVHDLSAIGQLEGFTHQASLILLRNDLAVKEVADRVNSCLDGCEDVLAGCTALPVPGILIRILGRGAEQLYELLHQLAELVLADNKIKIVPHAT